MDVKIRELSKMGRRQLRQGLSPQHRYSQHRILTYKLTIESQYLHQQNVLVGSILILGWGMIDEADGNCHEWRLICFGWGSVVVAFTCERYLMGEYRLSFVSGSSQGQKNNGKWTENDCFLNGNRIPLKTEFDSDLRVEKTITVYYTVTKALRIVAPYSTYSAFGIS